MRAVVRFRQTPEEARKKLGRPKTERPRSGRPDHKIFVLSANLCVLCVCVYLSVFVRNPGEFCQPIYGITNSIPALTLSGSLSLSRFASKIFMYWLAFP
jgi:hypothetical protein